MGPLVVRPTANPWVPGLEIGRRSGPTGAEHTAARVLPKLSFPTLNKSLIIKLALRLRIRVLSRMRMTTNFVKVLFHFFNMEERFQACLLLSAVGDSLGYRNGLSGFCRSGPAVHADIHKESPSGVNGITVAPPSWKLSDATVMSLGTAEAITGDLRGEELTAVSHQHRDSCVKPPCLCRRSLRTTSKQ